MAGQETLIYIDDSDRLDATVSARNFTKQDVQNRAYYNTLGAKLIKKFLTSENLDLSNVYNIHRIQKVLEEFDISDIMLDNIHIDVRVVFNENYIFVPKAHFEYDILPDAYLVLLMSGDKKYMKFLGFFEPKLINKNNQNEEYYFIEKEKLTAPTNLREYIENFKGNTDQKLSDSEVEEADVMMLSMIDHDITENDKKQLLKNLVKSAQLRDRFIEFENFEVLSYKAQNSPDIIKLVENLNAAPAQETIVEQEQEVSGTLDEAAKATAAALEELGALGMAASITATAGAGAAAAASAMAEADETLSAIDAIEGLTEVTEAFDEETDLTNDFSDFEGLEELSDIADETSDIEDIEDIAQTEEVSASVETPSAEVVEMEAQDLEVSDIETPSAEVETDDMLNLEEITEIQDTTEDIGLSEIDDSLATDFDELEPIETEDNVENETLADDNVETVDLESMDLVEPEMPEISEETDVETMDLEEISLGESEETSEASAEDVQENKINNIDETVDLDDIEPLEQEELSLREENLIETMDMDDLSTDEEPTATEVSDTKVTEEVQANETVDFNDIESSSLDEDMTETAIEEPELELGNFDDLTLDEEIEETPVEAKVEEENIAETPATTEPEGLSSFDSLIGEETIENTEEESLPTPEATVQNEEVQAQDKELDELLSFETFSTAEGQETVNTEAIAEPLTELVDINEMSSEIEETPVSASSENNTLEELKDLGATPAGDIETEELISQIDDLFKNEEGTEALASQDSDGDDDDKLELLFNSGENAGNKSALNDLIEENELDEDTVSQPISRTPVPVAKNGSKNKNLVMGIGAAVIFTALICAGTLLMKKDSDMLSQNPIEDNTNLPSSDMFDNQAPSNEDLMTNTPDLNKVPTPAPAPTPAAPQKISNPAPTVPAPTQAKPAASKTQVAKTTAPKHANTAYVSVKSLTWEVPDYLSYSDKVKKYLQTAGKSIRLSLSSDLLLATEYPYSNQVKVQIKLKNNGTVEDIQIVKSSGSNQINEIVLRSVKQTLNVVKPAPGEIPTNNFKLGLIINL